MLSSLRSAESIVASLPDAAVLLDTELNVVTFNGAYALLAGMRLRPLQRQIDREGPFSVLYHDMEGDRAEARKAITTCRSSRFDEVPLHASSGATLVAIVSYIPVLAGSTAVGVIQLFRDVSAEARMQSRYKELAAQERARSEELERIVAERTRELSEALKAVTLLSRTDALTQVLNRRAFMETLERHVTLARRYDREVSLLMGDLDFFKRLNDTYGHQAGDTVLVATARALEQSVRATDTVGRFGGEEFIIVLPETGRTGLTAVAQRCVQSIRDIPMGELVPGAPTQTISIGGAVLPGDASNADELIAHADAALYERKSVGRNGVTVFGSSSEGSPK